MPDSGIRQLDGIHQVMESNVSVAAGESCQQWSHQAAESNDGITTERTEKEIEPYDIRLQPPDRSHEAEHACRIIERPATQNREAIQFVMIIRDFVRQNREIQEGIAP